MTFDPTRAIVTGSDSGIGRATAVALAAAGMDVGITWHGDERGAQDTADEVRAHGGRAVVAHLDAGDIEGCGDVIDALAADLGGVDVFVNNAGTGDNAALLDLTLEQWRHTMAVDLDSAFVCLQRAARHMVRAGTGGRLIAITSVHEHQPRVGSSAYDAAKHGLGGLMKTIALELGQYAVTANSVAPGEIATPMTAQENVDPHGVERPGIPLGRPGDAREIAAVVAFLASPASSYIRSRPSTALTALTCRSRSARVRIGKKNQCCLAVTAARQPCRSAASPVVNTIAPGSMSPSLPILFGFAWWRECLFIHQPWLSPTTTLPTMRENHSFRRPETKICLWAPSCARNAVWVNRRAKYAATSSCHGEDPNPNSAANPATYPATRIRHRAAYQAGRLRLPGADASGRGGADGGVGGPGVRGPLPGGNGGHIRTLRVARPGRVRPRSALAPGTPVWRATAARRLATEPGGPRRGTARTTRRG